MLNFNFLLSVHRFRKSNPHVELEFIPVAEGADVCSSKMKSSEGLKSFNFAILSRGTAQCTQFDSAALIVCWI